MAETKKNLEIAEKEFLAEGNSKEMAKGYLDAKTRKSNPPRGRHSDAYFEYARGYDRRLQEETTSVEQERRARLG